MGLQQQAQRQKQPGLQQIGRTLQLSARSMRSEINAAASNAVRSNVSRYRISTIKKQQFHICRQLLRNLQHPVQPDDCHRTSRQQDTR